MSGTVFSIVCVLAILVQLSKYFVAGDCLAVLSFLLDATWIFGAKKIDNIKNINI